MSDKCIGAVLVIGDQGQLQGIISERDYARKVILKSRSSRETYVGEIMTQSLITAAPTDSVDSCMRSMNTHRVRHLPVLDGARVVGMLSQGDLVNWIISVQDATIEQLEHYIVGSYPG
jgi:CBS domain-containing protein